MNDADKQVDEELIDIDYEVLIANAKDQINDAIKRLNVHLVYDKQDAGMYKLCIGSDAEGQVGECIMDLTAKELYQMMCVLLFIAEKVRAKVRPVLTNEDTYKTIKRIVYMIDRIEEDLGELERELTRIRTIEKGHYQGDLNFITRDNDKIDISRMIKSTFTEGYQHIFSLIKKEYQRQIVEKKEQIRKLTDKLVLKED